VPKNYKGIPGNFRFEGSTLQDLLREATMAIDKKLPHVKNGEYRKVLIDTAYKLRDLSLRLQLEESKISTVRAAEFHISKN
jgi:hypothetical protein